MTYRLKEITCEVLEVTEATTAADFLAFGCASADPAGDTGGTNVGGHDSSAPVIVYPGMYVVKATSPLLATSRFFDIVDAQGLADQYELIVD